MSLLLGWIWPDMPKFMPFRLILAICCTINSKSNEDTYGCYIQIWTDFEKIKSDYFWALSDIWYQISFLWRVYYECKGLKEQIGWNIYMELELYLNRFLLKCVYLLIGSFRSDLPKFMPFGLILAIWCTINTKSDEDIYGRHIQIGTDFNKIKINYFWALSDIWYQISFLWSAYYECEGLKDQIGWKIYMGAIAISEPIFTKIGVLAYRLVSVEFAKIHAIWADIGHLMHN